MRLFPVFATLAAAVILSGAETASLLPIETQVTHGFATNNSVRIHYASLGQGPLVVMIQQRVLNPASSERRESPL